MDWTANAALTRLAASWRNSAASRRFRLYLTAFTAVYLLLFCQAIPTFIDEASSFNLATDKSLAHLFSALRDGADGSFPLYALIVYSWEKLFGSSELSLRLNSGVFILLFVWHSTRRLDRYFGPAAASLSLLFLLANKIFAYYAPQARFYGLVIFLFSLCFWSSWDLLAEKTVSLQHRFRHAFLCGLLCLSHPLGLVYAGILGAVYFVFSALLKRFSLANSLAFLGGPAMFLLWLPSFLHQRLVNPTYAAGPPGWHKYWQFAFFDSLTLFITLLVGLALFLSLRSTLEADGTKTPREIDSGANVSQPGDLGNGLLVAYALAFIVCLNAAFAMLDTTRIIPVYWMQAIRYLLVGWVAYSVIISAIVVTIARLLRVLPERYAPILTGPVPFLLALTGLLLLMTSLWGEWFRARASDQAFFSKISRIANEKRLDVVCQSHWDAFYLATRTPTANVSYLLQDNFPFKRYLLQTSKYYPRPEPLYPAEKLHYTNAYLFLTDSPREAHIINPAPR